jgi:hypothetical protein
VQIGLSSTALKIEYLININKLKEARLNVDNLYEETRDLYYCQRLEYRIKHLNNNRKRFRNCINIYFENFWLGHESLDSQFTDFLFTSLDRTITIVSDPYEADIILYSCYNNKNPANIALQAFNIIFLGENVRPYFRDYDLSLTSDLDLYLGRNIYMPLWMLEIDWFGRSYPDRTTYALRSLTSPRYVDLSKRKSALIYVGNNSEPGRISLINFMRYKGFTVDEYGSHTTPIDNKITAYKNYKLAICPENSYYPGYITEKPLHAWISETPYLYRSANSDSPLIRNRLCINIPNKWEQDCEFENKVRRIISSNESFEVPPLFSCNQLQDLFASILYKIRNSLKQFLYS